jgi:hypothetical protein
VHQVGFSLHNYIEMHGKKKTKITQDNPTCSLLLILRRKEIPKIFPGLLG